MSAHDKNLEIAIAKSHYFKDNVWRGYLTPSEILALYKEGVIPTPDYIPIIELARCRKKLGDGKPIYFNFYPNVVPVKTSKENWIRIWHESNKEVKTITENGDGI